MTNSNNSPHHSPAGWPSNGSPDGNHADHNETVAYPHASGGWGAPPNSSATSSPAPTADSAEKKSGKGWKIALAVLAVVVVLLGLGEFGARTYFANQITNSVKQEAEKNGTTLESDPKVSFGSSPLLLSLITGSIGSMVLELPSTINISYQDNDKSKPIVKGYPAVQVDAHDLTPSANGDDMRMGKVTIDTSIPKELMLAQAQKSTEASTGNLGFLSTFLRVTDIQPNIQNQTMDFQLGSGLATLQMKPIIDNGSLTFDVNSAEILGQRLPQQFVDQLKNSLSGTTVAEVGGLKFQNVAVTQSGLDLTLHGTNVDMNEVSKSLEEQAGTSTNNGDSQANQGAQHNQGGTPTPNPLDQSGAVGSS